ncbi:lipopolysaccharide core heptosyltransferase RfaQ [Erwinia sp. HR93]|uniref:lipopolysaccharide core heptosyltransferase RfaQ n=1 Tax=Erwinia sp. HR93 TaxID=3094840 RepID=UPI002ADEFA4A|nr:lipopolysaccharide core heptosyltransferase RfaQ [Erwinia sp. HR93]MEA1062828.1 lipopolysaccharide core heptosyltransferase RfaQ [Erwinia sp. HR93]
MEEPVNKILVIKMRFHGDMLLTTPVISSLKQHYPNAQIDVLLYEDTIPILSENVQIGSLYGVAKKSAGVLEKVSNFLDLLQQLSANRYNIILNLTDQWMVALLMRLIPAEIKISQDYAHRQTTFWKNSFTCLAPITGEHIVERNLSILSALGIKDFYTKTTMSYKPEHWHEMEIILNEAGVHGQYVVIQPTARQIFKCWDEDKFSVVTDALQAQGYKVVLTCGPGDDDLVCVNRIADECEQRPITALAGKTQLPELAALIDHAALFIGVDSAPMHMAAALDTPIVCLFGATDRVFWRPWTDNAIQLWAGDYAEMPEREELDRSQKYLSVIPAEDVIAAANQMLNSNKAEDEVEGSEPIRESGSAT